MAQTCNGSVGDEALEGRLLRLLEPRRDDMAVTVARQLAAPDIVGLDRRQVVLLEPGDVFLVGHRVLGAPEGVIVAAELVGQISAAMVFADHANVVSGVAQRLCVGPVGFRDGGGIGDVPLRVGERLVLERQLAGEHRGTRGGADRGGGEGLGEQASIGGERVDVRRLRMGVAHASEGVDAMLVGHEGDDVAHVVRDDARFGLAVCHEKLLWLVRALL